MAADHKENLEISRESTREAPEGSRGEPPREPSPDAEAAYAEFLRRREAGEDLDFEAFCRDRSEIAGALRILRSIHAGSGRPGKPDETVPITPQPAQDKAPAGDLVDSETHAALSRKESRCFGDYELLEEIGRGGMGVVYKARQKNLDRIVALKMLLTSHLATKESLLRFRAEAQVAARLKHPNLVKVFDVGERHGLHYFAMEHIAGGSLVDALRSRRFGWQESARLLSLVARAVDHLHHHGIVHRDLKPSNILIDESGQPYVTDFGLAKIQGTVDLTHTGAILGTPSYMSPEQASGRIEEVESRSDVYSLGAILYELLTGCSPFRSESPMATLVQVMEREPPRPRGINPDIPSELEQICLKCLEKSPANRYPGAGALADDLDRFLMGEPVQARSAGLGQRLRRWARREPALAARSGAIGLFYAVELLNYHFFGIIKTLELHLALTGIILGWVLASLGFQRLLGRERWARPATFLWGVTDVGCVTAILLLLNGVVSSLVVIYPLLVVGSGLWFHRRFVIFITAASMLSYAALMVDYYCLRPARYPPGYEIFWDRHAFFLLMLIVMCAVVVHQVRRVQALSRYYRSRAG
jgi:tRNA A-37 threonylcarbamoyl transferase component Bud32